MPGLNRDSTVLNMAAIFMAILGPLVAVPAAILNLPSKESTSPTVHASASDSVPAGSGVFHWEQKLTFGTPPKSKVEPVDQPIYQFAGIGIDQTAETVRCELHSYSIDGLIVLMPDPIKSSAAYSFDLRLDVLRKAAATHGYVMHRFFLPWKGDAGRNTKSDLPGLLLFHRINTEHKKKTQSEILLVYLVGETASTGLDRSPFHKAVDRLRFWASAGKKSRKEVRVLGPTFTGASLSLATAIRSYPDEDVSFHVVSGAANGLNHEQFLKQSADRASLVGTRTSSNLCRAALLKFVADHSPSKRPLRAAWLVESTGFGRAASDHNNQGFDIVEFSIPYNVSRVARELEKQSNAQKSAPLHAPVPTDSRLSLSANAQSAAEDVTPQFAPNTPALDELQLRQMMTAIREEGFRYIGITVTDPLDMSFLCKLLHDHCPNTQVLLVGGSMTLAHAKNLPYTRGVLVSSAFPLQLRTQHWTFPKGASYSLRDDASSGNSESSWMFAADSDSSVGLYNAMVLLLASEKQGAWERNANKKVTGVFRQKPGQKALRLVDFGVPFDEGDSFQPGCWVSAVGLGTLVPMQAYSASILNKLISDTASPPLVSVKSSSVSVPLWCDYPLSGAIYCGLFIALSAYAAHVAWRLLHRDQVCLDDLPDPNPDEEGRLRGRWYSLTDRLVRLWLKADGSQTTGDHEAANRKRQSLRTRQQSVLFVISFGFWGLGTWLSWLCAVPLLISMNQARGGLVSLTLYVLIGLVVYVWTTYGRRSSWSVERWILGIVAILFLGGVMFVVSVTEHWMPVLPPLPVITFLACFLSAAFWLSIWLSAASELFTNSDRDADKKWKWMAEGSCLAQFCMIICLALWNVLEIPEWKATAVIRFQQSLSITSGLSLLPTSMCLLLMLLAWSGFVLRRLGLSGENDRIGLPWKNKLSEDSPLAAVINRMRRSSGFIDDLLTYGCGALRRQFRSLFVVVFGLTLWWEMYLARRSASSFDANLVTWWAWLIGGVGLLTWIHTFWQAVVLRQMTHKLLRQIAWLPPLTEAIGELPERVRVIVGRFMDIRERRPTYLRIRLHCVEQLKRTLANAPSAEHWSPLRKAVESTHVPQTFCEALPLLEQHGENTLQMNNTFDGLATLGVAAWSGLITEWNNQPTQKLYPADKSSADELSKGVRKLAAQFADLNRQTLSELLPPQIAAQAANNPLAAIAQQRREQETKQENEQRWINLATELVAIQVASYLHGSLKFFYGLLWFLLTMTVFFVFSVLMWPLQPKQLLMETAVIMLVTITAFCVLSLFALERDRVHSILRGTTPDRVDFDRNVLIKLATAMAPAVLFLGSYVFPGAMQWLYSFIEPLSNTGR